MTVYLANAFSPSMLNKLPSAVEFQRVDQKEFCEAIHHGVSNAIGHKGTIEFVNTLCNTNLQTNRVEIKAGINDVIYIIVLGFRLEEGKVLSAGEVQKAYDEGKVLLLKAIIGK
ncbi:hypothetical protein [Sulfolobus monocaudavirus SMV4]|uniref:hypothetical protein n=1 Tax=Sulfolobus monocaudavirus SMV4 TaxID=1732178 RepID=UPI00070607C3|nr:hypothetical protein AVT99_gp61 [Sulfolobus monocaudavirus SMV4]ALG97085.1 hypothetical protein [Sulfolobus monocaudavirus SMV4]